MTIESPNLKTNKIESSKKEGLAKAFQKSVRSLRNLALSSFVFGTGLVTYPNPVLSQTRVESSPTTLGNNNLIKIGAGGAGIFGVLGAALYSRNKKKINDEVDFGEDKELPIIPETTEETLPDSNDTEKKVIPKLVSYLNPEINDVESKLTFEQLATVKVFEKWSPYTVVSEIEGKSLLEAQEVIKGDLHANPFELVNLLVQSGVGTMPIIDALKFKSLQDEYSGLVYEAIENTIETRTNGIEHLLSHCSEDVRNLCLDDIEIKVKELNAKYEKLILKTLENLKIINKDKKIILLGDTLADRIGPDSIMLTILEKMIDGVGDNLIIIASNHDNIITNVIAENQDNGQDHIELELQGFSAFTYARNMLKYKDGKRSEGAEEKVEIEGMNKMTTQYKKVLLAQQLFYYDADQKLFCSHAPICERDIRGFVDVYNEYSLERYDFDSSKPEEFVEKANNFYKEEYLIPMIDDTLDNPNRRIEDLFNGSSSLLWVRNRSDKDKGIRKEDLGLDVKILTYGHHTHTNLGTVYSNSNSTKVQLNNSAGKNSISGFQNPTLAFFKK